MLKNLLKLLLWSEFNTIKHHCQMSLAWVVYPLLKQAEVRFSWNITKIRLCDVFFYWIENL
jgi:hypothetical protein